MSGGALGPLIPLPKKYIKNPERIKEYESLENDPVNFIVLQANSNLGRSSDVLVVRWI